MDKAALIISIVALVISIMALPTVFQMFWGRPKINIRKDFLDGNQGSALIYNIWNSPVKSRILSQLGVYRDSTEISGVFIIYREGTNELIGGKPIMILFHSIDEKHEAIHLPPRLVPARIDIVMHYRDDNPFVIGHDANIPLPPGSYRVELKINTSRGKKYIRTDYLFAGDAKSRSTWTRNQDD